MYLIVLNVLSSQTCINYDTEVNANLTKHLQIITSNEQLVLCHPSNVAKKCIVLTNSNQMYYSIVLPVFELD